MTLKNRILIPTLILFTMLILGLGFLLHRQFSHILRANIENEFQIISQILARRVKAIFDRNRERLAFLIGSKRLANAASEFVAVPSLEKQNVLSALFIESLSRFDSLNEGNFLKRLFLFDLSGKLLFAHPPLPPGHPLPSPKTVEKCCAGIDPLGELVLNSANQLHCFAGGPIGVGGENRAVLVAEFDLDNLEKTINDIGSFGETGEAVLLRRLPNGNGQVVLGLRNSPEAKLRHEIPPDKADSPTMLTFARKKGLFMEARDLKGISVMTSTQYIPEYDWVVVLKKDTEETLRPLNTINRSTLFVLILAVLLAGFSAFILARAIAHPLHELIQWSRELALENFNAPTSDFSSILEIHQLENAFLRMAGKIQHDKQELKNKMGELESAYRHRSQFLANISHELRTPLNCMLVLTDHLIDNQPANLVEHQLGDLQTVKNSGRELLNLINDLLDLTRAEAGGLKMRFQKVCPATIIGNLSASFQRPAEQKGLLLNTLVPPNLRSEFVSDPNRVEQVLRNFLANAIKYTPRGSITLSTFEPDLDFQQRYGLALEGICFSVADTGVGISPEHQAIIFRPFQQLEHPSLGKIGGVGLGLSIAKEMGRHLQGQILVESEPGRGSTFTLVLPLEPRDLPPEVPTAVPLPHPLPAEKPTLQEGVKVLPTFDPPLSLLIVDPDLQHSFALARTARSRGVNILIADTLEMAMAEGRKKRMDLILFAVDPPVLSLPAFQEMWNNQLEQSLPPLFLLRLGNNGEADGKNGNPHLVLLKPTTPYTLLPLLVRQFPDRSAISTIL